jgi:hypothetical protein
MDGNKSPNDAGRGLNLGAPWKWASPAGVRRLNNGSGMERLVPRAPTARMTC